MRLSLLIAGCLVSAFECQASTLYKCVDNAGKITFTQQACPQGNAPGDKIRVRNPTISSAPPIDTPAPASTDELRELRTMQGQHTHEYHSEHYPPNYHQQQQQPAPAAPSRPRVTVVGGSQPQAECSTGLSDRDLRTAMVRGEIVPGMTRKQVASMYGPVNRNAPARGAGVTTYWNDKYVSQTSVRFDASGCAESSWQSGHNGR